MRTLKKREIELRLRGDGTTYRTRDIVRNNTFSGNRDVYTRDLLLRYDDRLSIVRPNTKSFGRLYV